MNRVSIKEGPEPTEVEWEVFATDLGSLFER